MLGCQNYDSFRTAVTKTILIVWRVGGCSSMKWTPSCCPLSWDLNNSALPTMSTPPQSLVTPMDVSFLLAVPPKAVGSKCIFSTTGKEVGWLYPRLGSPGKFPHMWLSEIITRWEPEMIFSGLKTKGESPMPCSLMDSYMGVNIFYTFWIKNKWTI